MIQLHIVIYKVLEKYLDNTKKVTSVIATDFAGHVSDWKKLKYLSKKFNFTLINDNCHAIGAEYCVIEIMQLNILTYVAQVFIL